jgi:hypothetical protein
MTVLTSKEQRDENAIALPVSAKRLLLGLLLLGPMICIGIVLWQLLYNGPFLWHATLPQFWQGGLEALALIIALAALQSWQRRNWRVAISLVIGELYLRRHREGLNKSLC